MSIIAEVASISNEQLSKLKGITLIWELFTVSHGLLRLRVLSEGTSFYIHFTDVIYLNCPTTMRDCFIRMDDKSKFEPPQDLSDYASALLKQSKLFCINCWEGTFHILSSNASIVTSEDNNIQEYLNNVLLSPLWENGPMLSDI